MKQQYIEAFAKAARVMDAHPDIELLNEQNELQPLKQAYAQALDVARTPELAEWAAEKLTTMETDIHEPENFIAAVTRGLNGQSDTLSDIDAARLLIDTLNNLMTQKPRHTLS